MSLSECPRELPAALVENVHQLGAAWAQSPIRPAPLPWVSAHWRGLVNEWAAALDLPLLLPGEPAQERGVEIVHSSGRTIVPTDDSPAHWAFALACSGQRPVLDDIRSWLAQDRVPIVSQQSRLSAGAQHRCCLAASEDLRSLRWALAYITRRTSSFYPTPIADVPLGALNERFCERMYPDNMFVVPREWSALSGLDPVRDALASIDHPLTLETRATANERVGHGTRPFEVYVTTRRSFGMGYSVSRLDVRVSETDSHGSASGLANALLEAVLVAAFSVRQELPFPATGRSRWILRFAQLGAVDEFTLGLQATYLDPNGQVVSLLGLSFPEDDPY